MNRFLRVVREYLGAFAVAFFGRDVRVYDGRGDRVFVPKYETWLRRLGVMGGITVATL